MNTTHRMLPRARVRALLALALFVLVGRPAQGQIVFSSGGGRASSAGYGAEATIGETPGAAASAGFACSAGFRASLPQGAPTGSLPALVANAGASVVVSALLDDDIRVLSASLRYRRGGGDSFASVPMALADSATGRWEATVPAGDVTVHGVQYYVEASDGVNVSTIPSSAPGGALASLPVQVTGHPAFSLPPARYVLGATPLDPANSNPASVFAALGAYDTRVWRFGTYDPSVPGYRELGQGAASVEPGQGFWIYSTNATPIAVSGSSIDLSQDVVLTLQPGFNQIGNPFAFPVDFADIVRPAGVEANLFGWSGTAYIPGVAVLQPSSGYWIRNSNASAVQIRIPPKGSGVARAPAIGPLAQGEEDGWSFVVRSEAGAYTDTGNRFGMRTGATAAKDAYDFADAPAPPGGYASVSFLCEEGMALLTDWRGLGTDGERWMLELRTDQVGLPYRVELTNERPLPPGWMLAAIGEEGREVSDLTGGGVLAGGAVSSSARRTWTLAAGPPAFVGQVQEDVRAAFDASISGFAFTPPTPHPVRAGEAASFRLLIPVAARGLVEVFDLTGRRVATPLDRVLQHGAHDVIWDGRDANGRRVAAGVYFVRARAADFVRDRKVVMLR